MNQSVRPRWLCGCGFTNTTTMLTCKHCGARARTSPVAELPEAFTESTVAAEIKLAHELLKQAVQFLHRQGAPQGTREIEIAGARLGRALALLDRPRNITGGRQVCSVLGCGGREIMPDGKCLEHGGR